MCLGVPGRITESFTNETGVTMGRVDFSGVAKEVCLQYVPEASVGDYVIVHLGFAISVIDEHEARQIIALLHEIEASAAPEGTPT